jgi:CRP-like cAMP-binding protein
MRGGKSASENMTYDEKRMLTVLEKVSLLQKDPLLQGVRTESLARVAAIAQELQYDTNQALFRENEAGEALFYLLDGAVSVVRGGREVRRLEASQMLGTISVLTGELYSESALAAGPVRVLQIDQQELYDAMADDFNLTRGILSALAHLASQVS